MLIPRGCVKLHFFFCMCDVCLAAALSLKCEHSDTGPLAFSVRVLLCANVIFVHRGARHWHAHKGNAWQAHKGDMLDDAQGQHVGEGTRARAQCNREPNH